MVFVVLTKSTRDTNILAIKSDGISCFVSDIQHPNVAITITSPILKSVQSVELTAVPFRYRNHYQQSVNSDQGVFLTVISEYYTMFHIDSMQTPDKKIKSS